MSGPGSRVPITQLGGVTLPNPDKDGVAMEGAPAGSAWRAAGGVLLTDVMGVARAWTLRWSFLTAVERGVVWGAWFAAITAASATQLQLPDGGAPYNVRPRLGSWQEAQWYDINDRPYYTVTLTFDEAEYIISAHEAG